MTLIITSTTKNDKDNKNDNDKDIKNANVNATATPVPTRTTTLVISGLSFMIQSALYPSDYHSFSSLPFIFQFAINFPVCHSSRLHEEYRGDLVPGVCSDHEVSQNLAISHWLPQQYLVSR